METDHLNGIVGTQEEHLVQNSDTHSRNESLSTASPSIKSPNVSTNKDALKETSSSTAGNAPRVIAGCLDGHEKGVQIDLEMAAALPHHKRQSLDQQSTREQRAGSTHTQTSCHHRHNPRHRAYPQQPSQNRHQATGHHHHTKSQRQIPTSQSRSCIMVNDLKAEDWNSGYGQPQPRPQMCATFPPANPQFQDGSFNVDMDQSLSGLEQIGTGPYFNQQSFSQYTPINQAQPTYRSAPNGYTDLQTCLPYTNPAPQEHPFHTGHQNQHPGHTRGSQQFTPQTTGISPWDQHGYDQNPQVTASPVALEYHQSHQPQGKGSDQSSQPQHDEYQNQASQQSIVNNPHGHYQQHIHHHTSIGNEDNENANGEVNQYDVDNSDPFNDNDPAEAREIEDGDYESTSDSVFVEGSERGSGSPKHKHKRLSPREKSQLFVHGSDDEEEERFFGRDNKNDTLQSRRHPKARVSSVNDNHNGSDDVPRGTKTGFSMPGTASEYLPSRYSGASIPQSMPNKVPKTKSGRYVSDASLRKRRLNRVQKNKVPKRAAGANDPENIKIVQLYDNDKIHSYDEIAEIINDDRRKQGRAPNLTGCAVSARYARTAPILYKAEGKVWVPPAKRKGPTTGPASIWNEELDLRLVSIKQEVDSTTWQQVTNRFNQETGNNLTIEQISTRYAAI